MYTTTVWVVIAGWVFSQEPPVFKLYATAANIEDSPKRYLDREVHLSGADLSLAFRAMESSDEERIPYTTAQINGRGHVIGSGTSFVFLVPGQLRRSLLQLHPKKTSIHADITIQVRKSTIATRGGKILYVGEITSVVEVSPK